jgi:GNAT superfamily N-acetyltransferase
MEKLTIRPAKIQDVSLILTLIKELAAFEQLQDQVIADEKTLHESLFVDLRRPEVLIAEEKNQPVGFVLFFHNFSTFLGRKGIYIEDLYVREKYRGKGYGKALLQEVCRIANQRSCGRVEWWVLDENQSAIEFYKKMGAVAMSDWTVFRLSDKALKDLGKI